MGATAAVHPTEQTLHSYGLGKLDNASAESVNKHLEGCGACQRRVAEMSSDSFLGRLRDAQGQPGLSGPAVSSLAGLSMLDGHSGIEAPPAASTLPPGLADHPDYEIVRELGQGGMGTVYLALNRLMGRHEVLKVVSSHLMNRRGVLDRFLGEIRNAARLHHTNIVTAYSTTRMGESFVFAMEYVEGLDLAKLVKAKGGLPVSNACNYIHQAALGLQHAHELDMVHRDIKPSNLMLASQGKRAVIKVLDFGLAKVQSEGAVDGGLTHEGQMLGTPDYISPEQISDARGADIRADVYSLGCTLYYLLTGRPPFQATSLYDLLQAHHSMDATPLNLARPEVPIELAALVAKMMAKEVERRFQTPGEVAQALAPFFKAAPLRAPRSSADLSCVETQLAPPQPSNPAPETAQPVTLASALDPSGRPPSKTEGDGVPWESLIAISDDEPLTEAPKPKRPELKPAQSEAPVRRPPWFRSAMIAASVLAAVALCATIYVATNNGRIKIVIDGPARHVTIDGETVRINGLGEPITLRPDIHELKVTRGDMEIQTRKFEVRRGANKDLRIEFEPKVSDRTSPKRETSPSTTAAPSETAPPETIGPGERDRRAAESVLSLGGTVVVRETESEEEIKPGKGLPQGKFKLLRLKLANKPELVDSDLESLRGLKNVVEIDLFKAEKITDAGLVHLRDLTTLRQLSLSRTRVTNAGLMDLCRLVQLESLNLGASRVTGAGLTDLQKLTNLRHLYLWDQYVTDADLVHLESLGQLESLELVGTRVTDAGLAHLKGLTNLRHLNLYHTKVMGAGLSDPRSLARINDLSLRMTPATDDSLVHLRNLPQLGRLDIGWTAVTDAGLVRLGGMTQLKELMLKGTHVTAAGVQSLQKSLPACRIIADFAVSERPPATSARTNPTNGFVRLFNGKDLTGWEVDSGSKNSWRIEGEDLVVTGPGDYRKSGFLLTNREYSDFHLKFDFQVGPGTNSGVAFWARRGELFGGIPHHPQIELFDADKREIKNGALIWSRSTSVQEIRQPYRSADIKPSGLWNSMEIEVRGGLLSVEINGLELFPTDLTKLAERPEPHPGLLRRSGRIGLQSHTGTVRFRNIEIKELNRVNAAGSPPGAAKSQTAAGVATPSKKQLAAEEQKKLRRERSKLAERMANLPQPEVEGSPWVVVRDELVSNPQGPGGIRHGAVYFGHPNWSDYDFTYKIKVIDHGGEESARFHVLSRDTYRALELGDRAGKDLYGRFNGVWDGRAGGGFVRPGIEFGRWYQVEFQIRKGLVTLLFDGKKIVDRRRNDDLQNGRLGFLYKRDEVHIRDVEVKALDGTPLWKGVIGLGIPVGE